jgi:DNA-binding LacI/PurR family transcriptional regulator
LSKVLAKTDIQTKEAPRLWDGYERLRRHPEPFLNWLARAGRNSSVGGQIATTEQSEVNDMDNAVWNSQYQPIFDHLAIRTEEAASSAGLSVPGDLSVAGFDDIPAGRMSDPPLTTFDQQLRLRGMLAAQGLCQELDSGRRPRSAVTETCLIVSESTGRPARRRTVP